MALVKVTVQAGSKVLALVKVLVKVMGWCRCSGEVMAQVMVQVLLFHLLLQLVLRQRMLLRLKANRIQIPQTWR